MKRLLLFLSALMVSISALRAHYVEVDGVYYNLYDKTAEVTYRGSSHDNYSNEYSGSVTIPEAITYNSQTYSVTSIGSYAFNGCSGLTSVTIPNSVASIGSGAFEGCSGLIEILVSSNNDEFSSENGVLYNKDKTTLIKYPEGKKDTSFTIPNSVTSIGDFAFCFCSGLTSVTIPNSVTSIGSYTFFYCSGLIEILVSSNNDEFSSENGVLYNKDKKTLIKYPEGKKDTSFTIPNSVTSIGGLAFSGCSGLTSVTIGESVTSIGYSAFYDCSGLTKVNYLGTVDKWVEIDFESASSNPTDYAKDLYINNELLTDVKITTADSIKNDAFYYCKSIKSVDISNSVTSIGDRAFFDCSGLTSVTIPNSVTSIGGWAFSGCSGLTSVTIPNSVTYIGENAFLDTDFYNSKSNWDNGVLYIDNCLIKAKSDVVKDSYTIKKETRIIGEYAFFDCNSLTSVTIPNSVTSIGSWAFHICSGLTSVTIPNSVTSIGRSAFSGCSGLTSVTIPNSVTSIGDNAFTSCSGLTEVTIGNSVTSIGQSAFSGCSGLTSVTIPNSVTSIGDGAFSYCSGLTSVTIGNSVTSIGRSAFSGCSGLTSVTIGNSVTSIGRSAFSGCSGLTSVTIGNSVTSIGYYAFDGCSGLTSVIWNAKNCEDFSSPTYSPFYDIRSNITSFTFGNKVEHIPANLCYGMSKLTEITIPNSVTSIGDDEFRGCSGLTSVTIPNSVTSIGSAFYNCSGLTKVNYLGTVDKWVEIDFENFNSNPTYYAKDLYINNVLLTDVKITTADSIKNNAFRNCQSIKSVDIGNSVTSIGSAFYNCSGLTSVTIPNSVTSIGQYAFYNCSGLTKVNYLGTVDKWVDIDWKYSDSNPTYYAKDLYINNELLTDVKITTADSIKNYAFYNCQSIKSVEIGNSVTSIGQYAFIYCSGLTEVTIPNSVTSIDQYAFYGCSGLTSVIWNAKNYKDFSSYSSSPFYNIRSNITSFTFGNEVEHIPAYLCYDMSGLKTISVPTNVKSIGDKSFYECYNLKKVSNFSRLDIVKGETTHGCVAYYADVVGNKIEGDFVYDNNDVITEYIGDSNVTSITIPLKAKGIYKKVFTECTKLISVVWNAKNCEDFSSPTYSPFYEICSNITSFTFGNEVEHIPAYLCDGMSKLVEITIPTSVTSIGRNAFSGCSDLTEILVLSNNEEFSSENGVLYNKDKTTLIKYPEGKKDTSFTIPNSVTYIGDGAFYGCNGVTSVTIPNSVTTIGENAFSGCSGLTKVNYLGTVDKWVEIDFDYDSNPTYYAKDLYINNELLIDVKITSADNINMYAFYGCQSIKSVVIGDSVISIGYSAFSGCNSLKTVYNCSNLEIKKGNEDHGYVAYYADKVINGCPLGDFIVNYEDKIIEYIGDTTVNKIEIPEFVTGIEADVFAHCKNLNKITILSNEVPNAYISSFAHYNAYLYVPCDVYEDYDLDYVFGNFKYIKCISAEEVEGSDKVEIEVDSNNNATIIWPSTGNASSYELVISKNGEVFCTLLFNENGQLTSIDFGNRSASVGFQFTVTGLDAASKYSYSIVAKDEKGNELESYNGTFTTNGYSEVTAILETLADANITISGGLITCSDAEFTIYNTLGQDVTAYNGSLQPGVYVVSIAEDVVKVMMK